MSSRLLRFALGFCALSQTVLSQEVHGPVSLSLHEVIHLALQNNPDLQVFRSESSKSMVGQEKALALFWPQWKSTMYRSVSTAPSVLQTDTSGGNALVTDKAFTFSTGLFQILPTETEIFTRFGTDRTDTTSTNAIISPYYSSKWEFGGRQRLLKGFDWFGSKLGSSWSLLQVAERNARSSENELKQRVSNLLADVENAYWALVSASSVLEARTEAIRITEEQKQVTERKIEAGLMVAAEIHSVQERIASRRVDLLTAQREVRKSRERLTSLLHLPTFGDDRREVIPSEIMPFEIHTADRESLVAQIEQTSPRLHALSEKVESKRLDMIRSRNLTLPTLDVAGSYFFLGGNTPVNPGFGADIDELTNPRSDGWQVSLVLEVPLGRSPDRADYHMARVEYERTMAEFQSERNKVEISLLGIISDIELGKGLVETAQETVELAKKKLEFEQRKFESGLTISSTLLQFQEDLATARIKEVDARMGYRKALVDLDSMTGKNLEKFGVQIRQEDNRFTTTQIASTP